MNKLILTFLFAAIAMVSLDALAITNVTQLNTSIDGVKGDLQTFIGYLVTAVVAIAGVALTVWGGLRVFRIVRRALGAGGS